MKIEISLLTPHPLNQYIYGNDDDLSELIEKIKESNWIKPILITKDYVIISGHRRVECCKILGITEIECEVVNNDPIKHLELLVGENCYRVKTNTQRMKESEIYFDIEKKKSYQRQTEIGKQNLGQSPVMFNRTELGEQGRTSEIVSKKIGMSESSYRRGKKVMDFVEDNLDFEWFFTNTMDQSIDKSVQMTEKPIEFIEKVIEKVNGDKTIILPVIKELEQEEQRSRTILPPGKYVIITFDYTNRFTYDLLLTDISSICEEDCVLLMWVRPHQIVSGLEISKHWGFRYCTCLTWNKDVENQISLNVEILLISIMGSPKVNFKEFNGSPEKPTVIKDIIENEYQGWSKVEIFVDDGWKIW